MMSEAAEVEEARRLRSGWLKVGLGRASCRQELRKRDIEPDEIFYNTCAAAPCSLCSACVVLNHVHNVHTARRLDSLVK
eukprot:4730000-Amphidinium_carterae.1